MEVERLIGDLCALAYEAGSGEGPWEAFGHALRGATGAGSIALWNGRPEQGEVDILLTEKLPDGCREAYASHFVHTDPWTRSLAQAERIALGHELIGDRQLRDSEFYQDFARELGMFHLIGHVGLLGDGVIMPQGLHRPEDGRPFTERERAILAGMVPHLGRAVRVQRRLRAADASLAEAALEALPLAAMVLDASSQVMFASPAALQLSRSGALPAIRRTALLGRGALASDGAQGLRLARLIRAVASGITPGGGMRWEHEDAAAAITILPLPRRLAMGPLRPGMALLLARSLTAAVAPPLTLVQQVFGLTRAEAEVAIDLAAGLSGPQVAKRRQVTVATVRTQARQVLEKTGAASLRDVAVMLARLSP